MNPDDADSAGGHFRSGGAVLVAMGVVALVGAYALDVVFAVEMAFITPAAMCVIGVVNLGLGAWMIVQGRRAAST